jgi:XTP/dITP diphosphohydrolase
MINVLLVSTRNPHKLAELREMLAGAVAEIVTPDAFPGLPDVVEDRDTLEGNALKKAEELFLATGIPAMADDTGLEVDALHGAPGVFSARFAGEKATYAQNVDKLLTALAGTPPEKRNARFRTVIAFVDQNGHHFFEGVCEGIILTERRGNAGFGYDPVFMPIGENRTFAEMSDVEKNAISHRGRAMQTFVAWLTTQA